MLMSSDAQEIRPRRRPRLCRASPPRGAQHHSGQWRRWQRDVFKSV